MSHIYRVSGRTVATAATAAHGCAALWNLSTAYRLTVFEIAICTTGAAPSAGCTISIQRISARGTPGSTITPNIASDDNRTLAPASGAVLDLATYTVQPTVDAPSNGSQWRWGLAAVQSSGVIIPFGKPITIPAGAGLAIVTGAAIAIPASDVTFTWEEN